MKLFEAIPSELFSILASPNRHLYADALEVLYCTYGDSDRIIESVRLLRKMHLQAIICTPPDKLPDIGPLADKTLLVRKDKYNMNVLTWSKETESVWNEG